jgi:hypothetical protein
MTGIKQTSYECDNQRDGNNDTLNQSDSAKCLRTVYPIKMKGLWKVPGQPIRIENSPLYLISIFPARKMLTKIVDP